MSKRLQHFISAAVFGAFLLMAFGSDDTKSSTNDSVGIAADEKPAVEILKQTADYEPVTNSYTIHCRVKNNTDGLVRYLDLQGTFYDKQKNIVGTGIGNAANLAAGAEKTVDVMGLDIDNVDTYEVQVNNVLK